MKYLVCTIMIATLLQTLLTGCDSGHNFGPRDIADNHRPAITGKILRSDGLSPASGAIVTLQPRSAMTTIQGSAKRLVSKRTILTASNGSFSIDSCKEGVYTIESIDNEGNAVRIDSVVVAGPQATTELPARSLQLTGALRGKVHLDAGGDPSNVFILVFGSDRFMQVRNDGTFLMENLSYGNYELKIVCILPEYSISYSVKTVVIPNDTISIDSILLQSQEPCVPQNVTLEYDTMRFAVILKWNECTRTEYQGYNIYRYNKNETDQYVKEPLNDTIVKGPSFVDAAIQPNQRYVYGVAVVTSDGKTGRKSEPLEVTSSACPFNVDTLRKIDGMKTVGVFWDSGNELTVAYDAPWLLTVVNYDDNGLQHNRIDIQFDRLQYIQYQSLYKSVYINNNNIYLMIRLFDSTVACYNRNGLKRYECNVHHMITHWCVHNDTLIAGWDTAGSFCTSAFDTTGRSLFQINRPQSCFPTTYAICTTDSRIISTRCSEENNCVLQAYGNTGLTLPQLSDGNLYLLDAYSDRYLFSGKGALLVQTAKNEHIARIPSDQISPVYSKCAAINSEGKLAFIQRGQVVVVTLP